LCVFDEWGEDLRVKILRPALVLALARHLISCLIIVLLLFTRAGAQSNADQPFRVVHAAFFAVSVPDINASAQWYSDKLGLTVVSRFKENKIAGALLAGTGLEVELIQHDEGRTPEDAFDPAKKVLTRGIFKAGFRVDDLDRAIAILKARGVEIVAGPFPPRRDQRANALIRDNAGNLIQLFGNFAP
jgi:catechol 2,3-dioxygenase-like lactoylglutathione lyase family enzyme